MPGYTSSNFGDDECDRNLEDVKYNIMFAFEKLSKNKQVNDFRENIMFVLDKINDLQEKNQALQGLLQESKLKMKKVSKTSQEIIRKLQAKKDEVVKDKLTVIYHLEIEKEQLAKKLQVENKVVKDNIIQKLEDEKEQLAEISHMQSEKITTLTGQLEKSRKMLTKEITDRNEIMIACHKRIKEESALRQKFEDNTNHLNEIPNQHKCSSIEENDVKCNHEHEATILVENKSDCCPDHSSHYIAEHKD